MWLGSLGQQRREGPLFALADSSPYSELPAPYSLASSARPRRYDVRTLGANQVSALWPKCDARNGSDKAASITEAEFNLKIMTIGDGLNDREAETVAFDAGRGGSEEPIEDPRK
jgi:hypothetical protein